MADVGSSTLVDTLRKMCTSYLSNVSDPAKFLQTEYDNGKKYSAGFCLQASLLKSSGKGSNSGLGNVGLSFTLLFDLDDLFDITQEGKDGWVTVTGVTNLSAELTFDLGNIKELLGKAIVSTFESIPILPVVTSTPFKLNENNSSVISSPDKDNRWIDYSLPNVNVFGLSADADNGFSYSPGLDFTFSLGSLDFGVFQFEVKKSELLAAIAPLPSITASSIYGLVKDIKGVTDNNAGSGNGGSIREITNADDGTNILAGTPNNDKIYAGNLNAQLQGLGGDDYLEGGDGNDVLDGGAGSDTLMGGKGSNTLIGGTGDDTYAVKADSVLTGITGETSGGDTLEIVGSETLDKFQEDIYFSKLNNDLAINFTSGNTTSNQIIIKDYATAANRVEKLRLTGFSGQISTVDIDLAKIYARITAPFSRFSLTSDVLLPVDKARIDGTAGDDLISASDADNTLTGSAGNDTLYGNGGNDFLFGNKGNDTLIGGTGNDYLSGGADNDSYKVDFFSGSDSIDEGGFGGYDILEIDADGKHARIDYNIGFIRVNGSDLKLNCYDMAGKLYSSVVIKNMSNDSSAIESLRLKNFYWQPDVMDFDLKTIYNCSNGKSETFISISPDVLLKTDSGTIRGSSKKDYIVAADSDNVIYGNDSGDDIYGNGGNDVLNGNSGVDNLDGGAGNDYLYGGADKDTLVGGTGDDYLYGQKGDDIYLISCDMGNDYIIDSGDTTNDVLQIGKSLSSSGKLLDSPSEVYFSKVGNSDLKISFMLDSTTFAGSVTIKGMNSSSNKVEKLRIKEFDNMADAVMNFDLEKIFNDATATPANGVLSNNKYVTFGETLYGTEANDNINGTASADCISAMGGNDTINGWNGKDFIYAGEGDDYVNGDQDDDCIDGGKGNDFLTGGSGVDTIVGGKGNDVINGLGEEDIIYYSDKSDGTAYDVIDGGSGNDTISYAMNGEIGYSRASIMGGSGNDTITVGYGDDTVYGAEDSDTIVDMGGNNYISGGGGNDSITGYGTLEGNKGNDTITVYSGIASGGGENDTIYMKGPNCTAWGGLSDDRIIGSIYADIIDGGSDNDNMEGKEGDDIISGGFGDDTLNGGQGNDTLSGGGGNNVLSGGLGKDKFVLDGNDIVNDFTKNDDKIVIGNFSLSKYQGDVKSAVSKSRGGLTGALDAAAKANLTGGDWVMFTYGGSTILFYESSDKTSSYKTRYQAKSDTYITINGANGVAPELVVGVDIVSSV